MTGQARKGSGAQQPRPEAGFDPFGEIMRLAMAAQERSLGAAQAWSDSLLRLLQEQAEGNRAVLAALTSSLAAMERALVSQEETNRALRQSLDAYREVIERAGVTQERSARLIQSAADQLAATLQAQLAAARALLTPPGAPPGAPQAPLGDLMRQWNAALRRLLEATSPSQADRPDRE